MKLQLFSRNGAAALAAAAVVGFSASAWAQKSAPTLKAGDKAPALAVEKWVKGEAVKSFEPGKVYVVEFWATWCGPCIASMPHLSELQQTYKSKGVTIIGCTSQDPNNSLDQVEAMVREKGDGMGYTVAWDAERATNSAYMKAAGQNGIPTSFLIDSNGAIAWIGHPMFLDLPLEMVASGKWDPKTGPGEVEKAVAEAQQLLQGVFSKAQTAPKEALEAWDTLEKKFPAVAHQMSDQKFQLYLRAQDYDKAYPFAAELIEKATKAKDSNALNSIAWTIVDPEGQVEKKDLELALKAASKANDLTDAKNPAILDTLARVYFLKGDANKAIELQTKAVDLAKGAMKQELQKALDDYKAKGQKKD